MSFQVRSALTQLPVAMIHSTSALHTTHNHLHNIRLDSEQMGGVTRQYKLFVEGGLGLVSYINHELY